MPSNPSGALSHIRVLDLSRVLAGPWCTQILADLGAEVIKIERPGTGDETRHWGPPYLKDHAGNETSESAYFLATNRGKKSVAIDISTDAGQALILELAKLSDVCIENFKVGGLKKYGLDYDQMRVQNEGLIYCSITGFGQTGPYKDLPGYDILIQAMGGLMSITGQADVEPGGGPVKVGVAMADILTGLYAAAGINAALVQRQATGKGQYLDLALLDVQIAGLANQAMNYLTTGQAPGRLGNANPNIVPYESFATADGQMILAVGNDAQFKSFCRAAGCDELSDHTQYATNAARVDNRDTLIPRISEILTQRSTESWVQTLRATGVPCGPVNSLADVFQDPQVESRGTVVNSPHPLSKSARSVANPLRFSGLTHDTPGSAPLLGQHTVEILSGILGTSEKRMTELRKQGVIP